VTKSESEFEIRLRRAIRFLPDPIGLGLPDLERAAKLVRCICRTRGCAKPVAIVAKTDDGPLFCGRRMRASSMNRIMELKAVGRPRSPVPSWDGTYALLIRPGYWYGSLETYCDKHGRTVVEPKGLEDAAGAGGRKGHFIKLALPPMRVVKPGSTPTS
jgi:hypothetical protein